MRRDWFRARCSCRCASTHYMLAKGAWFWTPSSNDAAFFFIGLVLILGPAGRTWGIDETLDRRMPSWLG